MRVYEAKQDPRGSKRPDRTARLGCCTMNIGSPGVKFADPFALFV